MKITKIRTETIISPLKKKFKTALRIVDKIENICVFIETDKGLTGLGCAVPTAVITGETAMSIKGAVSHIHDNLSGLDVEDFEIVMQKLHSCIVGNNSAKAAVDMALYDIIGKHYKTPLYRFLGGSNKPLETDMTVGIDTLEKMASDAREVVENGFNILKLKVGIDPDLDVKRLKAVRKVIGTRIRLRIDANQGWSPKEAVSVMKKIARENISIDLLEQPVYAKDYKGMKFVRDNTDVPVYADESVFSPEDALEIINMGAVDGINIKLMKCGGIYNGLKIAAIAESAGVNCMIGSMMESSISVTAAAHLAAAKKIIKGFDLDAPLFIKKSPAQGGITYNASIVTLPDQHGLGIQRINR
ncbi:MAG: dipeptide epimerase [Thermodesulfobacteriota bacterium]